MSNSILFHKYASINEAPIYKAIKKQGDRQRAINKILLGTWVGITKEKDNHYYVRTAGADGWINKNHVSDDMGLKIFFVDVGQGDGIIIEIGNTKILVDAGPNSNIKNYLTGWQYTYLLDANKKIHLDYVFISHFDFDHYAGMIDILNDNRFTFGTLYHNGIARFADKDERPSDYNTDLGKTIGKRNKKYLITTFDSIADLKSLKQKGGFAQTFGYFCDAVLNAHTNGRLEKIQLATYQSPAIQFRNESKEFSIGFLGPVSAVNASGNNQFKWFTDSSHTRNGHSLVLKLTYDKVSILLTGDLNTKSQKHLMKHYKNANPFLADVSKGCHHGSSDFNIDFLKKVSPYATVISSGDNESHSHPRADAIGAAGKYSRGKLPKVYSTELARSINKAGEILYGMINLRTNGDQIYMAQMKEAKQADIWDSYVIIEK